MFYNQTKDGYLLDIFADAAIAVAASSSPLTQEQLPSLVDVFCPDLNITMGLGGSFLKVNMDTADLPSLIVHDSSHQLGLVGLLDYVLASKGAYRDHLVSVCLNELDKFPEMAKNTSDIGFFGEEDPEHYESFSFEIGSRLLKVAESFPDVREPILRSMWSWMTSLVNIALEEESFLTKIVALPFKKVTAKTESLHPGDTATTSHVSAENASHRSIVNVAVEIFKIARNMLASLLDSEAVDFGGSNAEMLWTDLIAGRPAESGIYDAKFEKLIVAVRTLCTVERWPQILHDAFESLEAETHVTFYHVCVQSYVYSSILYEHDQTFTIALVFEFLKSYDPHYLDILNCEVILTTTEALAVLAKNNPELAINVTSKVTELILEPPAILQAEGEDTLCAVIRNCQADILAKCLKKSSSSGCVKSCLYTVTNHLSSSAQRGGTAKVSANCTTAIKAMAPVLKSSQLIEVVIPAMIKSLNEIPDLVTKNGIWNSLGTIAMSCDADVFREVFSLIGPMLAKNSALIDAYLDKLLTVFLERGAAHAEKDASSQPELLDLGKNIAEACESETFPTDIIFSDELTSQFRSFWLYAVMSIYKPGTGWPSEWLPVLKSVALRTPTLLLSKDRRNLEADLNSNSILRAKFVEQTFTKARNNLSTAFNGKAIDSRSLSNNSVVFLLAIYHVESLRVSRSSLAHCLLYLRDERYYNSDIYPFLELIVDEVTTIYLRGKQLLKSSVRKSIEALIEGSGYRLAKVRSFSARSLKRLMAAVPGMLWDRKMVFMMLDFVQFLDATNFEDASKKALLKSRLGFDFAFTDDADREATFKDFEKVAFEVITMALERSAGETSSLLQAYLADLQLNHPELFIFEEACITEFMSKFCLNEGVASDVVKSLSVRANYIGEIRGLHRAVNAFNGPMSAPLKSDYVNTILKNELKSIFFYNRPQCFYLNLLGHFYGTFAIWERTILDKKGLYEGEATELLLRSKEYTRLFAKFMHLALDAIPKLSSHPMLRETVFLLATLGVQVSEELDALGDPTAYLLFAKVVKLGLDWFTLAPTRTKSKRRFHQLISFVKLCVKSPFTNGKKVDGLDVVALLVLLLESEMTRSAIWINPLSDRMPDSPSLAKEREFLMYWAPIPPVTAPWCLQYAVYVLDYFPIDQVFFYVPQLVQALRYDSAGYVELFILKAAKFSQLFAVWNHQIIWNMKANMFKMVKEGKHEEKMIVIFIFTRNLTVQPDTLKPALDRIIDKIVSALSGEDQAFFEREFKFFSEVTGISGNLSRSFKKARLRKSNPESIVVDIDYDSGRPLQSHAKAPFMATFKIRKLPEDGKLEKRESVAATSPRRHYVACGIIEVIPKSISRDMMGREKVNSLPNYFLEKWHFRQFCIPQDFGFILDIAPGGIEFEASPFKLTTEMITIMGGDANTAEYKLFSDLVVRSYLAIRPHAEEIVEMVRLMLDSGLPCFKGEQTITKLRDKFQPGKSDRQAADFMLAQIKAAHENQFSRMYDRFQNLQNGIPF
ncbi:hypothetical protein BC829DRAFT_419397 [Chytridium lagenaria]|nr:hypothetical protein BC829DRAFT_419397 [Chytridium lagenaria]